MQGFSTSVLFKPAELAVYAICLSGVLFFTGFWAVKTPTLRVTRLVQVFFSVLFTMLLTAAVTAACTLMIFVLALLASSPHSLDAIAVWMVLGPLIALAVGTVASWFGGAAVIRSFRNRDRSLPDSEKAPVAPPT